MKKLDPEVFKKGIALVYACFIDLKQPDGAILSIWYKLCRGFDDDVFVEACNRLVIKTRRPSNVLAAIRQEAVSVFNETHGVQSAEEAFAFIDDLINRFYDPNFNTTTWKLISDRCPAYLRPMLSKWGPEIAAGKNTTATRAQFRDHYNKEITTQDFRARVIEAAKNKQIEAKKIKYLAPAAADPAAEKKEEAEIEAYCKEHGLETIQDHIDHCKGLTIKKIN